MKQLFGFVLTFLFSVVSVQLPACTSKATPFVIDRPPFLYADSLWVDSVYNSLTPDERIAQLIMVRAHSDLGQWHIDKVVQQIKEYKVGGLAFFQGGPVRQAKLVNYYQSISKVPLIIGIDAEWGLNMRLDSTIKFPKQIKLGAIENDSLIYEMGAEIARECKRLGIHINFAPVLDVNNNPKNPVIGSRSFGDDPVLVAKKGYAYMAGMQENGIMPTGKHFPGHGDTDKDSHHLLPVINHSLAHLDSFELYPFKYCIDRNMAGVMVGHLNVPVLDSAEFSISSLSKKIVTDLLQKKLGFEGFTITDGLGMKAVANYNAAGEDAVNALIAGNDMLALPQEVPQSILAVKQAIAAGVLTWADIERHCKKLLAVKYWVGLNHYKSIKIEGLYEDLNSKEAKMLNKRLADASIGLLQNQNNLLPFRSLEKLQIASFSIGETQKSVFQKTLDLYKRMNYFSVNEGTSERVLNILVDSISKYECVALSIHTENSSNISQATIDFADKLMQKTNVVITFFSSPYSLNKFKNLELAKAVIIAYDNDSVSQSAAAQAIFGGIPFAGKLPVNILGFKNIEENKTDNFLYSKGTGISTQKIRLQYNSPEELNISPQKLSEIDILINDAIKSEVFPGCQILAAKDGKVFYYKSFGYHTYSKQEPVLNSDIYDLASVTKTTSTLACVMKLVSDNKINIDNKLSVYLTELDSTNKKNLIIRDILRHQAKLMSGIGFYKHTLDANGKPSPYIFDNIPSEKFSLQVAEGIYISPLYKDTVFQRIANSELLSKKEYLYSDLGFLLMGRLVEKQISTTIDKYVRETFYNRLGAETLCFNPTQYFDKNEIVPTANEPNFRKQLLHGYVHDEAAAILGGVAGHAGLFGNANDLAKMMQMYLQKGEYGGDRYISAKVLEQFCAAPSKSQRVKNRRALGFDKPFFKKNGKPVEDWLSETSFGHGGFTGTYVWADPATQIVYIFLSNRIHPNRDNDKIIKQGIRNKVHELIYEAVGVSSI